MVINRLEELLIESLKNKDESFKRLFHGRGGCYEDLEFLTIDSISEVLFVTFFSEVSQEIENNLLEILLKIYKKYDFSALVLQRRYLKKDFNEILAGILPEEVFAIENNLKFSLNLMNQNIGFFPDMKIGHEFIYQNAKDKKVLNLFSYTCAFSVFAMSGGASLVVNVDMAKGALTTGRKNHHLNNIDTTNVHFMPYNILKSWNRIKKYAPYDVIIIDPPSFQRGSFAATKDYEKIIKRLPMLAEKEAIVLSALNAPELDTKFLKDLFNVNASEFSYLKRLDNSKDFPAINEEKSLKNMIFEKSDS